MRYTNCNKAYCSAECGAKLSLNILKSKEEKRAKSERAENRKKKLELKQSKKNYWVEKIESVLHPWIKLRDKDEPCISCGKFADEIKQPPAGHPKFHAGHFRTKGAAKQLRFNPLNIHKQCFWCNCVGTHWSTRGDSVASGYEERLLAKIGQEALNDLKFNNEIKRYTIPELKEILNHWENELIKIKGEP